jgi:hypothetical protein
VDLVVVVVIVLVVVVVGFHAEYIKFYIWYTLSSRGI